MLRTLQNALDKVRGLIADPGGDEPLFTDELITAGLMDSLHAILPWVAVTSTSEFDGDGTTHQFELPADLYEVQAVHAKSSNSFLPRIGLFPGSIWTSGEGTAMDEQTFIEYPSGYISLAVPPNASDKITIFYTAYWPETVEAGDSLSPPEMCYPAMCYYAASYCLQTKGQSAANIRQYNTKVDSGNPEHNPVLELAKFYLRKFEDEISRHPLVQKGQKSR